MKAIKIIDMNELQLYRIEHATNSFKNKFNKKNIIIGFSPNEQTIVTKLTNDLKDPLLFTCLCYVFSYEDEKKIKKELSMLGSERDTYMVNKYCGMNGVNQDIYTKSNNIVLSIFSLEKEIYDINYLADERNITTDINELNKLDGKQFNKAINNIIKDSSEPNNTFENLIANLSTHCPLNYGGSLRRFQNVITENDLKKCKQMNNKYYIGYDIRFSNDEEENRLNKLIENLQYDNNKNEYLYIFETYNNSIESIIKQCKDKKIKYTKYYDKCIKINANDYDKLKLIATTADYV